MKKVFVLMHQVQQKLKKSFEYHAKVNLFQLFNLKGEINI